MSKVKRNVESRKEIISFSKFFFSIKVLALFFNYLSHLVYRGKKPIHLQRCKSLQCELDLQSMLRTKTRSDMFHFGKAKPAKK